MRHSYRPLVWCSVLILLSSSAYAQQKNDAQANAILQRANAAMGCGHVNSETTITVTGSLHHGTTVMPLTIQSQGNSRWRTELDTPKGRKTTIISDGKGQMQHADGHVQPLAEHNTSLQRPTYMPCLTNMALPPGLLEATYLRAEPAGADTLDVIEILPAGHPTLKAEADRMKTVVWISRSSGYLLKLQYTNAAEQNSNDTETVEVSYWDYRVTQGLAVPFTQVTRAGALTLELHLDSVQLNTPGADFNLR